MDMTGEYRIPAPRQRVWEALNDPEILKAAIPGCEELTKVGDNDLELAFVVLLQDGGDRRLEKRRLVTDGNDDGDQPFAHASVSPERNTASRIHVSPTAPNGS